jgi:hypothetical protein
MNVLYSWNQTTNPRIAISNIWCGLEALFGDKSDKPVTRKLVEKICSWVPSVNSDFVEQSYNRRCDAIHGRWLEDDIWPAVYEAEGLLRLSLTACVENNRAPVPDWI